MAHKYICPVCDHELKNLHYCSYCHKFVKEPWVFHGDNLPNEISDQAVWNPDTKHYHQREYSKAYGKPDRNLPYDQCHPQNVQRPQVTTRGSYTLPPQTQQSSRQPSGRPAPVGKSYPKRSGSGLGVLIFVIWLIIMLFSFMSSLW